MGLSSFPFWFSHGSDDKQLPYQIPKHLWDCECCGTFGSARVAVCENGIKSLTLTCPAPRRCVCGGAHLLLFQCSGSGCPSEFQRRRWSAEQLLGWKFMGFPKRDPWLDAVRGCWVLVQMAAIHPANPLPHLERKALVSAKEFPINQQSNSVSRVKALDILCLMRASSVISAHCLHGSLQINGLALIAPTFRYSLSLLHWLFWHWPSTCPDRNIGSFVGLAHQQ